MNKNHSVALGFSLFAPFSGMSPQSLTEAGHYKQASDAHLGVAPIIAKQQLVSAACHVMDLAGLAATKAGIHLNKVASTEAHSWTDHHIEVADLAADVLLEERLDNRSADLHKSAFTPGDLSEGLLNVTKAGVLLSAIVGGALGTGYFAVDRAFGSNADSIAAKEQELKHFRRVGEKLQTRLASKYGYQPVAEAATYSPEEAAYV